MQPRFSTKLFSLSYDGELSLACQGANNVIIIACHMPQSSTTMSVISGALRRLNNGFFAGTFHWSGRGKNTTPYSVNAYVSINFIQYAVRTLVPGEVWIWDVTVDLPRKNSTQLGGGIFFGGASILQSHINFIGSPA